MNALISAWLIHKRRSWFRARRRNTRLLVEQLEDRCVPATFTVNALTDLGGGSTLFGDLRYCITQANQAATAVTISFDTTVFQNPQTITLTGGTLTLTNTFGVTIDGLTPGLVTISGNNQNRIFVVNSGATAFFNGLTLANGAAVGSPGGAIQNFGSLTLTNDIFVGNVGSSGGAIAQQGTALTATNVVFVNNSATGSGGALLLAAGTNAVVNSTFFGNSAGGSGAAIATVGNAQLNLINDTITANTATSAGGGVSSGARPITIVNTIIAQNTGMSLSGAPNPDVVGPFISQGTNLVGATDGSSGFGGADKAGTAAAPVNPLLGPLTDNGGNTLTCALLVGSPAIDAAKTAAAPATDQRGVARPFGISADIGAYEANAHVFVVTNTNDSGPGSLRQALFDANLTPNLATGPDVIQFAIPGSGPQTIAIRSALPAINDPVIIDGYSQPGSLPNSQPSGDNAVFNVAIDGGLYPFDGLTLTAGSQGSIITGLAIEHFGGTGIVVDATSGNVTIAGDFIGTDPKGTLAAGNAVGILVSSNSNTIGGSTPAARNVISGNSQRGLCIDLGASGNLVENNIIGLDASATTALANLGDGVLITGSPGNTIGGTTASVGNIIGGNQGVGINISGTGSDGNIVQGNFIGTNTAQTAALGNLGGGVSIAGNNNQIGGTTTGAGNVIAYNGLSTVGAGVEVLSGTGNSILGNSIFGNGSIGIDLNGDGVTANDPGDGDVGPNNLQNTPTIQAIQLTNGQIGVILSVDSAVPNSTYPIRVEFFLSDGTGQGRTYIGFVNVTAAQTTQLATFTPTVTVPIDVIVTATATDAAGNTSEFAQVPVAVAQAPVTHLQVTGFPLSVPIGIASTFTVSALDAFGNVVPTYLDTIHFTSDDTAAVLPPDYMFTTTDAGVHSFTATLNTVGTHSITASDTFLATVTGSETGIVVTLPAASLVVTGLPAVITPGLPATFTLSAVDVNGAVVPGYTGTVHFTSSDALAQLPPDVTFTAANAGSQTFSVVLKSLGSQTLTAIDTLLASVTGSASTSIIEPSISASGASAAVETVNGAGAPYTLSLLTTNLGNDAIVSWTVDWSDGTINTLPGNATTASHVYSNLPNFELIAVTAVDARGVTLTAPTFGVVALPVDIVQDAVMPLDPLQTITLSVPGMTVTITSHSSTGVSFPLVGLYNDNPTIAPLAALGFWDFLDRGAHAADVAVLVFTLPPDAINPRLEFFDTVTNQWQMVVSDNLFVDNADHLLICTLDSNSTPSITDLSGTVFTIVVTPPALPEQTGPLAGAPFTAPVAAANTSTAVDTAGLGESQLISSLTAGSFVSSNQLTVTLKAAQDAQSGQSAPSLVSVGAAGGERYFSGGGDNSEFKAEEESAANFWPWLRGVQQPSGPSAPVPATTPAPPTPMPESESDAAFWPWVPSAGEPVPHRELVRLPHEAVDSWFVEQSDDAPAATPVIPVPSVAIEPPAVVAAQVLTVVAELPAAPTVPMPIFPVDQPAPQPDRNDTDWALPLMLIGLWGLHADPERRRTTLPTPRGRLSGDPEWSAPSPS
jgi:predicted outer membrane repeat protein